MSRLDLILLVLLVPFVLKGSWRGFCRESFGLAGILGGAVAASAYAPVVAAWLDSRHALPVPVVRIAAGVLILFAAMAAAAVLGVVADRVARTLFLGGANRLAGALLGLGQGATVLGFVLLAIGTYARTPRVEAALARSRLAPPLTRLASNLLALGKEIAGGKGGKPATGLPRLLQPGGGR